MGLFENFRVYLDVVLILIPIVIAVWLIFKFIVPKNPKLGYGLAIGGGILGAFLVGRKLKKAFQVEDKLSQFSGEMEKFKTVQKRRQEAVMANKQVIDTLEKKRVKMAKNSEKFETELGLIDAELKERKELNGKLINNAEQFLVESKQRSESRMSVLERFKASQGGGEINVPLEDVQNRGSKSKPVIELNGYALLEG